MHASVLCAVAHAKTIRTIVQEGQKGMGKKMEL